jgi:hypothetical protein
VEEVEEKKKTVLVGVLRVHLTPSGGAEVDVCFFWHTQA